MDSAKKSGGYWGSRPNLWKIYSIFNDLFSQGIKYSSIVSHIHIILFKIVWNIHSNWIITPHSQYVIFFWRIWINHHQTNVSVLCFIFFYLFHIHFTAHDREELFFPRHLQITIQLILSRKNFSCVAIFITLL